MADQSPLPGGQRTARFFGLFLFLSCSTGCAGHAARTLEARHALDAGRPTEALALYNEELDVESSKDLPEDTSGDNALLILDRSIILQQLADFKNSSRDLEVSDKQIEMLDFQRGTLDDIGQYIFSDDTGPYRAPPYEKLLINTMNMVNYLARHDLNGARVEARRLAIMQKYVRDSESPASAMIAPGSYLAGFAFERSGEADQALRYYDEALQYGEFPSLVEPIRRLREKSSFESERIRRLLAGQPTTGAADTPSATTGVTAPATGVTAPTTGVPAGSSAAAPAGGAAVAGTKGASAPSTAANGAANRAEDGDLLVIVQYGRVPAKEAKRVPIGLALTFGALYLSDGTSAQANSLAAQGLVTWVNYPELEENRRSVGTPSVKLNGRYLVLESALNVEQETREAYEAAKGRIIAAAITRTVTRVVAGTAAGAGAKAASNDGVVGLLVSLGTQAALTATDTPDTRSWATLPARITVSRARVPAGRHTVELQAQGASNRVTVDMKPGGWQVVTLTVLR